MKRRPNETGAAVRASRKDQSRTEAARILVVIQLAGHGLTILEIATRTGIVSSTVSARLDELRKANHIEEAPFKRNCTVNGLRKKIWQEAPPTQQFPLFTKRQAAA